MPAARQDDDALLDRLQWETFEYFLKEVNPSNGLIADKTRRDWRWAQHGGATVTHGYKFGLNQGPIVFMIQPASSGPVRESRSRVLVARPDIGVRRRRPGELPASISTRVAVTSR